MNIQDRHKKTGIVDILSKEYWDLKSQSAEVCFCAGESSDQGENSLYEVKSVEKVEKTSELENVTEEEEEMEEWCLIGFRI